MNGTGKSLASRRTPEESPGSPCFRIDQPALEHRKAWIEVYVHYVYVYLGSVMCFGQGSNIYLTVYRSFSTVEVRACFLSRLIERS